MVVEELLNIVLVGIGDGDVFLTENDAETVYLPRPEFLRTHRSYIVHMTKAEQIDRFRIVFGEEYIPISDSYMDDVQQFFDNHTLA